MLNPVIRFIVRCRFATDLVLDYNYTKGGFTEENGYSRTYLDQIKIFENYRKAQVWSTSDFNLKEISVVFSHFANNIINLLVGNFLFIWLLFYSSYHYITILIYLFKNINRFNSEKKSITFYGVIHIFFSFLFEPIKFIFVLFLEHLELAFGSFAKLFAYQLKLVLKTIAQIIEIALCPLFGIVYLIIKMLRNAASIFPFMFKQVFKKISVNTY